MRYFLYAIIIGGLFIFSASAHAEEFMIPMVYVEPIKILIVPGHDEEYSGAEYRDTVEADINLALSERVAVMLETDKGYDVTVARNVDGYIAELEEYFENEEDIEDFIKEYKDEYEDANKDQDPTTGVIHNDAPPEVATRLYGINMWAAENDFDVVVHVHFNDIYPRRWNTAGGATGYAVYVPDSTLPNHEASRLLGTKIGNSMKESFMATDYPLESAYADEDGVIEGHKLIAVGSNGTLDIPSILVEYSYIYEKGVQGNYFPLTSDTMARATAVGVMEYFSGKEIDKTNLSYEWKTTMRKKSSPQKGVDVLALQYALYDLGYYPPEQDRVECPFSGIFGPCTEKAVKEFQKAYSLSPDGIVGSQSRALLNSIFKIGELVYKAEITVDPEIQDIGVEPSI